MEKKSNFRSFHICTVGCKTNQCESDEIARTLALRDYYPVKITKNPGIIIINTCTVTSAAARKVRQYIRRSRAVNPDSRIIITGCHAVFNSEELKKLGADLIVQNNEKENIPGIVDPEIKRETGIKSNLSSVNLSNTAESSRAGKILPSMHSRAQIKIQDGCQQSCRYCIVPFVRGKYKSTNPDEIINKVRLLTYYGYDEVVFTGIHIGKYGIDLNAGLAGRQLPPKIHEASQVPGLASLLYKTLENTTVKRIRLSSLEINEIDKDLIEIMRYSDGRIAPHLHIPLQSGSERILKAMNRQYSCSFFLETVEKLKKAIPGLVLTTDVIVGFPSEEDDDFNDTISAIKKADFKKTHVFKYSRRPLTEAYNMERQVDEKVKSIRSKIVREMTEKIRDDYISSLTGARLNVACETYDRISRTAAGTSENYIKVYFNIAEKDFSKNKCRILGVKVLKKYREGLYGSCIKD